MEGGEEGVDEADFFVGDEGEEGGDDEGGGGELVEDGDLERGVRMPREESGEDADEGEGKVGG